MVPLATSASVVNVWSAFRLVDSAAVVSVPFEHVDPLTDTSWHSCAWVELVKLRAFGPLSAALARHGSGVGVELQFTDVS